MSNADLITELRALGGAVHLAPGRGDLGLQIYHALREAADALEERDISVICETKATVRIGVTYNDFGDQGNDYLLPWAPLMLPVGEVVTLRLLTKNRIDIVRETDK